MQIILLKFKGTICVILFFFTFFSFDFSEVFLSFNVSLYEQYIHIIGYPNLANFKIFKNNKARDPIKI